MQSKDKEMPFIEHIRELKDRVKVIFLALIISTIFWLAFPADLNIDPVSGLYRPFISVVIEKVKTDIAGDAVNLIAGRMTSPLELYFLGALFLGMITSSPIIAYEIYAYIDPALYPHERRIIYGFVAAFTGLFLMGVAFGYFIAAPLVFRTMLIFFEFTEAEPLVLLMDFYALVFTTVLLIGLVFTAPAVFVVLVRFGVVSTRLFTKNRLYIYGGLYIIIALITPDGWLVGNSVLFFPLVLLLELSIIIARRFEKRREAELQLLEKENPGENPEQHYKCKFCGEAMEESEKFCPNCGRAQG